MPILKPDILRMQQEGGVDGQLRIGTSTPGTNGGKKPVKLTTWRITSPSRHAIHAAAEFFGGTAEVWDSDRGRQWQVVTPLSELPVQFGGGEVVDQWMTYFERGVLKRRCTGAADAVDQVTGQPCECNATGRELCKPETKLLVRLVELPGIGWWRFTSRGKHVAAWFPRRATFLQDAANNGVYVPARLVLREMVLPGKKFPVVDIDIDPSVAQIASGEGVGTLREIAAARHAPAAITAGSTAPPHPPTPPALPAPQPPAPAATQPEPHPAELAQQAADWAMRNDMTREKIVGFLEKHGKTPAMDEFVAVGDNAPLTTLRDMLADRLDALTPDGAP